MLSRLQEAEPATRPGGSQTSAGLALEARHVSKHFRRYVHRNLSLKGRVIDLLNGHRQQYVEFDALRDVSFSVPTGQMLAIVGRNGAGKSTLLRILARVIQPDAGDVRIHGRVSPLLELGAGFAYELSGRRNIYLYGALLGLSRQEITEQLASIIDFSEIGDFIDTPVKFYSSGMFVRLGFSVAIHAEPRVLLVDEVLAVGDFAFQMKCFDRMMEIREAGTTVVVVSHNLNAVRKLCDRTVLLHQGRQRFDGDTAEAIGLFHALLGEYRDPESDTTGVTPGLATIDSVTLHGDTGRQTGHCNVGDQLTVRVAASFLCDVENPVFGMTVARTDERVAYVDHSARDPIGPVRAGDSLTVEFRFPALLAMGSHTVRANITKPGGGETWALSPPVHFYVTGRALGGAVDLGGRFEVVRDGAGLPR
jgi:ABC-2 type transport system ATP-binding protein